MTSSTLSLGQIALAAHRDEVFAIPTPDFTETWKPLSHRAMINAVLESALQSGLSVKRERYGLSGKPDKANYGHKMFGVLDFASGTDDYGFSVGIRNSHDKSMSAGICAGVRVLVCDNLMMTGEFSERRKHTHGNDFLGLIRAAFTLLPGQLENLAKNLDRLKLEGIDDQQAEHLIWNAVRAKAINSSMMLPIWEEFKEPTFEEFRDPTQFNLLMAFTEKLKAENSLTRVEQAYRKLGDIFAV